MPSRLALGSAIAVIVLVSAMALLWHPSGAGTAGRWLTPAEAVAEYRQEQAALEARGFRLAPGWHWPAEIEFEKTGPDGAPMVHQQGSGAGRADAYWFASWAGRAVSTRVSRGQRQAALRQLERVRQTLYYRHLMPESREYLDETIAMALSGDLSRLRQKARAAGAQP